MSKSDSVTRGLEASSRRSWEEARELLAAADGHAPLAPEDLERLAEAAFLSGRDAESAEAWARAHSDFLERGDVERAARCAFWLGFGLVTRGERARAGGWFGRAHRLLEGSGHDCVERGYLLVPAALGSLAKGEAAKARAEFRRAAETGDRFEDADLAALGRLGSGQALIRLGEIEDGVSLLDEAMAAAEAGELSPIVVGTVYCAVIETCHEIFDLRRAAEWTVALTRWCESQPQLVPYRGQCLARRAEILELRGAWRDALNEACRACERLAGPPGEPAAGLAFYRRAELHRLLGDYPAAERAYENAARWGYDPQPGLALLRLGQDRTEAAVASIHRVVVEAEDPVTRCRVLPAHVRIMLAAGEVSAARRSAEELAELAASLEAPFLAAVADQARGSVELVEGNAATALDALRSACATWERLSVPYEAARCHLLIGLAYRELGDQDTARVERDAARSAFRDLDARPDLERLDSVVTRPVASGDRHGLTPRELEVLRYIATGDTNRAIAEVLSISERTVERHVSNIFHKLSVSTRSAATSYAYEHKLL